MTASVTVRRARVEDAAIVARLLHDFNTEFDTASPGVKAIAARLRTLLADDDTTVLLAGNPAVGVAVITRRPNVWFEGPVALLDELYVMPEYRNAGVGTALIEDLLTTAAADGTALIEINVDEEDVDAQRFYRRHGFADTDPDSGERAFYFSREL